MAGGSELIRINDAKHRVRQRALSARVPQTAMMVNKLFALDRGGPHASLPPDRRLLRRLARRPGLHRHRKLHLDVYIDIALAAIAALLNIPIREPVTPPVEAAA